MTLNDVTHIDIQMIRNLLQSRLNEGRELMKSATTSSEWKRYEKLFQDKCSKALRLINEAIDIKEGKMNEVSNDQATAESNQNNRQIGIQDSKG